jgi:hypothetical protein
VIGDSQLKVAKLYDMLPAEAGDTSEGRTATDNATVRAVFVIGADKKIKAMLTYPMSSGRNSRGAPAPGLLSADRQTSGSDPRQLEAGRGCDYRPVSFRRAGQREVPGRLESPKAVPAHRSAASLGPIGSRYSSTPQRRKPGGCGHSPVEPEQRRSI